MAAASAPSSVLPVIAVFAPVDHKIPTSDRVTLFQVGHNEESRRLQVEMLSNATAILWIPCFDIDVFIQVWPLCKSVKWVHCFSAGVDYLKRFISDCLLEVKDREVTLTNGRGAFSDSLAEYAMAGMLHFNKQFKRCELNRMKRKWDVFEMDVMKDKTVGLLGYGSIGKKTGEKVKAAFGCKIIALRRQKSAVDESSIASEIYGYEEKSDFFSQSDFIVCSLPHTSETFQFIGKDEIAMMKKNVVFVSVGRGAVVDEEALVTALSSGHIKGAVLDVFAIEPLPETSPLWDLDNVIITAHNADLTADYKQLGVDVWNENLTAFLDSLGGSSRGYVTPVDIRNGY